MLISLFVSPFLCRCVLLIFYLALSFLSCAVLFVLFLRFSCSCSSELLPCWAPAVLSLRAALAFLCSACSSLLCASWRARAIVIGNQCIFIHHVYHIIQFLILIDKGVLTLLLRRFKKGTAHARADVACSSERGWQDAVSQVNQSRNSERDWQDHHAPSNKQAHPAFEVNERHRSFLLLC